MVYVVITHDFQTVYQKWLDGLNSKLCGCNILILSLTFSVSGECLKNGFTDSIQIWHVVVTGFQDMPYAPMYKISMLNLSFLFFHRV